MTTRAVDLDELGFTTANECIDSLNVRQTIWCCRKQPRDAYGCDIADAANALRKLKRPGYDPPDHECSASLNNGASTAAPLRSIPRI